MPLTFSSAMSAFDSCQVRSTRLAGAFGCAGCAGDGCAGCADCARRGGGGPNATGGPSACASREAPGCAFGCALRRMATSCLNLLISSSDPPRACNSRSGSTGGPLPSACASREAPGAFGCACGPGCAFAGMSGGRRPSTVSMASLYALRHVAISCLTALISSGDPP